MTVEGMVLGSADYIAPEQIDDAHAADIRADIYSLGCTLYFLLAGRPPFPDRGVIQKLIAHREKSPRPLADIRANVPPELAQLVARMIEKNPDQRFQTPEEVVQALTPFADARFARAVATDTDAPAVSGARPLPTVSLPFTEIVSDRPPAQRAVPFRSRAGWPWVRIAAALGLLPIGATLLLLVALRFRSGTQEWILPAGVPTAKVGEIDRFPSPNDLPELSGTIVVVAPPKHRGGPSLVYAWDRKSKHPSLLFSRKSRLVQELHAFAVARDGRQYYLCSNERSLVQADKDGEKTIFTHTTYVRDLALDDDDNVYFSEGSGAGADGKIYRLVAATGKTAAHAELIYTVVPGKVSGYWDGNFGFGRTANRQVDTNTIYLSTGNSIPGYIFRITRNQAQWSAPACIYHAGGRIMGLVLTSPGTAYYVADNKLFRLTNTGSKVVITVGDVSGLLHVSVVPEGTL